MTKNLWRIIPITLFFLLAIFLFLGLKLDPRKLPSALLGTPLPRIDIPRLQNFEIHLTNEDLIGHVALLNFWGSWCDACAEEQLFLMQLAEQGMRIYGINYKDKAEPAKKWLEQWGNPYRLIGFDNHGKVGMDLGVYGTPETFLINDRGQVLYRYAGVLDDTVWRREFVPILDSMVKPS